MNDNHLLSSLINYQKPFSLSKSQAVADVAHVGRRVLKASLDPHSNSLPVRPSRYPPVHPDSDGPPNQILVRDESDFLEAAVLAVVPIVAHEEVVVGGNGTL